ncbi:MAG: CatA-like O-acetyltransferase [Bacteroidota bacterium]
MKHYLDIKTWSRKNHFDFFKEFSEPFFGVTVEVDCSTVYNKVKREGKPVFLTYLYKSLIAVNKVENFRYRIEEGKVAVYDQVDPAPTVPREDDTFGFSSFKFHSDYDKFIQAGAAAMAKVKKSANLDPSTQPNVVQYSVLPWLSFTSNSHARQLSHSDSVPKITFGKLERVEEKLKMPMSVHVNHALMDGYHVGQYVEYFQELLNQD